MQQHAVVLVKERKAKQGDGKASKKEKNPGLKASSCKASWVETGQEKLIASNY